MAADAEPLVSALYHGETTHARCRPVSNRFTYKLQMAYIDLSELEAGRLDCWPLFSTRTALSLLSVLPRDHTARGGVLSERIRELVEQETGTRPEGPVRLLTGMRVLGMGFNPVSFFYVADASDRGVEFLVAEVCNFPWLERAHYVMRPSSGGVVGGEMAGFERCEKMFHVSPFVRMEGVGYEWVAQRPGERVAVRIRLQEGGTELMRAGLRMRRVEWGLWRLGWAFVKCPWYVVRVVGGILYEAEGLFRMGVPFIPHPEGSVTWLSWIVEGIVGTVAGVGAMVKRLIPRTDVKVGQ